MIKESYRKVGVFNSSGTYSGGSLLSKLKLPIRPLDWVVQKLQTEFLSLNSSFSRGKGLSLVVLAFFFWKIGSYCLYDQYEDVRIKLRKGPVISALDVILKFWTPQSLLESGGTLIVVASGIGVTMTLIVIFLTLICDLNLIIIRLF